MIIYYNLYFFGSTFFYTRRHCFSATIAEAASLIFASSTARSSRTIRCSNLPVAPAVAVAFCILVYRNTDASRIASRSDAKEHFLLETEEEYAQLILLKERIKDDATTQNIVYHPFTFFQYVLGNHRVIYGICLIFSSLCFLYFFSGGRCPRFCSRFCIECLTPSHIISPCCAKFIQIC